MPAPLWVPDQQLVAEITPIVEQAIEQHDGIGDGERRWLDQDDDPGVPSQVRHAPVLGLPPPRQVEQHEVAPIVRNEQATEANRQSKLDDTVRSPATSGPRREHVVTEADQWIVDAFGHPFVEQNGGQATTVPVQRADR